MAYPIYEVMVHTKLKRDSPFVLVHWNGLSQIPWCAHVDSRMMLLLKLNWIGIVQERECLTWRLPRDESVNGMIPQCGIHDYVFQSVVAVLHSAMILLLSGVFLRHRVDEEASGVRLRSISASN